MNGWAVVTEDDWLCFGLFWNEEKAALAARQISRMHGITARTVELRRWSWKEFDQWKKANGKVIVS